ncbi:phage major capsid protein [Variovorax sp. OV329]|uniref:phage major capsid protein n=1 Tax=Variovorax sp. OV329 TaxID=1882825 RepID=UPI0008E05A82|nr:phage major capsid protein [Variovorax sp. OV329]SFL87333.1 hypothetical protein SAMN05444747_10169 [Variovorax sp. OV329]
MSAQLAALVVPPYRPMPEMTAQHLLQSMGLVAQAAAAGRSLEATLGAANAESITRAAASLVARAVQDPATTFNEPWAGALVQEVATGFVDLLATEAGALVPQLPMRRVPLVRGAARVPMRKPGAAVNLAAAWRAEGAPIRVGALTVSGTVLTPKSMGVMGTYSKEALSAAAPSDLEAIIREAILVDSAKVLDATFFDDQAATDERPAGIGYGIPAGDTAVSSGTTTRNITDDLRARLDQLLANGYGNARTTRWVMNSGSAATLAAEFAEVQTRGTLLGYAIMSAPTVPSDVVYLMDFRAVAFTADAPLIEVSDEAVVHEESDPAALEEDISVASPVRSLFQTNCAAMKAIWEVNWQLLAPGAVQVLQDVAW